MPNLAKKYYCDRCSKEWDYIVRFKSAFKYKDGSVRRFKEILLCADCEMFFIDKAMGEFLLCELKNEMKLAAGIVDFDDSLRVSHEDLREILGDKLYKRDLFANFPSPKETKYINKDRNRKGNNHGKS